MNGCEPVTLLALLKHPLCRLGGHEFAHRPAIALLERAILRGPRPRAGADGLEHALQSLRAQRETLHRSDPRRWLTDRDLDRAAELIAKLKPALAPLTGAKKAALRELRCPAITPWSPRSRSITKQIAAFAGRDGGALRDTFQAIADSGRLPPLRWSRTIIPICSALSRPSGWYAGPAHPARACASTVRWRRGCSRPIASCLRGLVEGVWPPEPRNDPWLNRPMRQQLGLDLPERRIGLSAHDFVQAFGAPRSDPVACVEARRLADRGVALRAAACGGCRRRRHGRRSRSAAPLSRLGARARPAGECRGVPNGPEPRPPVAVRPKRLPVTEIEHWLRDPYTIYAKHILKLQALDPVDTPPGARDRGTVIHKAIGDFTAKFSRRPARGPACRTDRAGARGIRTARRLSGGESLLVAALRPDRALVHRLGVGTQAQSCRPVYAEVQGELKITPDFMLTARADRIEQRSDGTFAVLDYKTGRPPSQKGGAVGFAPQLTLQATILRHGDFRGRAEPAARFRELMYLRLNGGDPGGEKAARDFERLDRSTRQPTAH